MESKRTTFSYWDAIPQALACMAASPHPERMDTSRVENLFSSRFRWHS